MPPFNGLIFLRKPMSKSSCDLKYAHHRAYMEGMNETVLRIASYNIRKARGLDQLRRPERTLEVINTLGADIVVLQEADKRLGRRKPAIPRRMIEKETDFQLAEVSQNGISLGWHGNAVLLRPSVALKMVERITLPGLDPRGALRFDVDVPSGLCIVATHLGLRRYDRRAQLKVLSEATSLSGSTVIAGDFNEWSRTNWIETLSGRFNVHTPGRTFHARRPMAALDRFALSSELHMKDCGVKQDALSKRASDHLPIWSDIVIPAQGGYLLNSTGSFAELSRA
jgi:endonuclease/exonuclease/phosphatase family metal-dependent hydrolase